MKIYEVTEIIDKYAPLELAEDFDNVGLLIGNKNDEVSGVLLTLDVDMSVAEEATKLGVNLIISHHPLIFNPLKKITSDTPEGRCILYLIQNNISVYAAHTNFDSALGGLNDLIAALLGLHNTKPLCPKENGEGLGRVGNLKEQMTLTELASKVKEILNIPIIKFSGSPEDVISSVAICSGGGGSMVEDAIKSGADVYISGDIKYNNVREAMEYGLRIIEVGHYESEILASKLFQKILSDSLGDEIVTHITIANKNIYQNYV